MTSANHAAARARAALAARPHAQRGLTRSQVAKILGCSPRHVDDLGACGDLERFDIACSGSRRPRWRYFRPSVLSFIDVRLRFEGKEHDAYRPEVVSLDSEKESHDG